MTRYDVPPGAYRLHCYSDRYEYHVTDVQVRAPLSSSDAAAVLEEVMAFQHVPFVEWEEGARPPLPYPLVLQAIAHLDHHQVLFFLLLLLNARCKARQKLIS